MKTIETMGEQIILVPYLRKGLGQHIKDGQRTKNSRAVIDLTVNVKGTKASGENKSFSADRELVLVGPGDVKKVKPGIISHYYPPVLNTQRFNPTTLPFIEFYEADFPWRYTPLPVDDKGNCIPWLVLVAVNEDEYKLVMDKGKKTVEFNLSEERYNKVFPSPELHSKLAHVQLEHEGDNDGIARLLCASELEQSKHVTVFLLPAFETGRMSGLDENYVDISIDERSWSKGARKFPVYYNWSFYTDNQPGTFETLANKLDMAPKKTYNTLKANLTVDIAESGLVEGDHALVRENKLDENGECVIDVPAALNLALGNKKSLREEPQEYKDALKDELLLNPVFTENATGHSVTDEDPWVVPPVYGARHLLSEDLEGNGVVPEVNLTLRHRIAAGMGSSVVKENQESFVHRAWQKVEKINELNQKLREYYQMKEVEQKTNGRLKPGDDRISELVSKNKYKPADKKLSLNRFKLITSDSLPRALNSSKLARQRITINQVLDAVDSGLQAVGDSNRIIGITPDELSDLFSEVKWNDIINGNEFNTMIANEMVESYKSENNWLQYLLMPYYNEAEPDIERRLIGVNPKKYDPAKNTYLLNQETTELYKWMEGYLDDELHTIDYYYNVALAAKASIPSYLNGIFNPDDYDISESSPIEKAVYPLHLFVDVDNRETPYSGYVMDANLFTKFCNKYNLNLATPGFVAFEYQNKYWSNIYKEKQYIFLFSSDYTGPSGGTQFFNDLIFIKGLVLMDTMKPQFDYTYVNGKCVLKAIASSTFPRRTTRLFTDNAFYIRIVRELLDKRERDFICDPKDPGRVYVDVDYKDENKIKRLRRIYFPVNGRMGISIEKGKPTLNRKQYKEYLEKFKDALHGLDNQYEDPWWMKTPMFARVHLNSFKGNIVTVETFNLNMGSNAKRAVYQELVGRIAALKQNGKLKLKHIVHENPVNEPAVSTVDLQKETRDTVNALVNKYGYTEEEQLEEIKRKGLTKYPVMIYPEYLDPTFFYLRELSQNYVVPSAGELANNSVTIFESNTAFEEAFLMGMNTEMGQELLWREYPTDQRGSYFRKFWVASHLPEKKNLKTQYYDIKEVSDWTGRLGENHVRGNASMLVFAIKGELMQAYPRTTISLSKYEDDTLYFMAQTSMASWLNEDTYLVGFEGLTVEDVDGLYLTFQEEVSSLQFEQELNVDLNQMAASYGDSALLAKALINDSSVFLLPINNN